MQQKMVNNPRTLRDFLISETNSSSSCSSNAFKSSTMRSLIELDLNSSSSSPSKNSNPRILNSLLNAVVKSLSSFAATTTSSSSKSPSKRAKKQSGPNDDDVVTVRIKDIVRWRSFRDAVEDPPPLDDFSTTSCSSTTTSLNGSSWSESDFTCGYLSSCDGNTRNDVVVGVGKRFSVLPLVGKDLVDATTGATVGAKEEFSCQEEEIQSPVSVLQTGEDEFSPFDQNLDNIERRKQKSMQTIQTFESLTTLDKEDYKEDDEEQERIERRARELLHHVKPTGSAKCSKAKLDHQLLLDFFRDELKTRRNNYQSRIINDDHDDEDVFGWEIMKIAEDWIDGSFEYDLVHSNKDDCIREMDRRQTWSKFEEEQEELAWEIETDILENLIVEIFKVR